MRGADQYQREMLIDFSIEAKASTDHLLRTIRALANEALPSMSGVLTTIFSCTGRPSLPPERLIRAPLTQVLCSIRSERQLLEQMEYNLSYRWFVALSLEETLWDTTSVTRNRLINADK